MAVSDTQMLANIALERAVIRHAFPGNDVSAALAETVWATLSDKLLYFPESLAVWAYAQRLQEESSSFPSWGEIISAQVLLPYADYLRHAAVASFVSIEQVTRACRTLRDLSQRRMMQNQATRLSQAACDMSLPLSTVLDTAADVANVAVSEGSSDGTDRFVFDGKHNTGVQELTKWLIDPKRVPSVLRTGLTDFDEACGGFPDTGVVLLGATTSSGKSVMAKQVGLNMVRSYMGMRVSMVTLFARMVHGTLAPAMERYTRQVTLAWSIFFGTMALESTALFFAAPVKVWSGFANFLTAPYKIFLVPSFQVSNLAFKLK